MHWRDNQGSGRGNAMTLKAAYGVLPDLIFESYTRGACIVQEYYLGPASGNLVLIRLVLICSDVNFEDLPSEPEALLILSTDILSK